MKLLNQNQLQSIAFNKLILVLFFYCAINALYGQHDIEKYIPHEESPLVTHPQIEIRTIVHVIKRSHDVADNLTEDSLSYITQQYDWINSFYRDLRKPTLATSDGVEHHIPSARLEFKVVDILFHVDANDWDRMSTEEDTRHSMNFVSYNESTSELVVEGKWKSSLQRAEDSLKISFKDGSHEIVRFSSVKVDGQQTVFKLISNRSFEKEATIITAFKENNRNCATDLWDKYATDKNALHVFYTGSSKSGIAFGCGPQPYFLNVTNIIKGGDWAGAQLTAHELGHTVGLSHTDRPQFDDLPKADKFGFIDCNQSATSNNIMGYNICRNYLSPKQVGYVHSLYSKRKDRILLTTANEYIANDPIEIWDDAIWDKAMVVKRDIVIRRGQTLKIQEQLHMAAGATIYLEAKAQLIVDGAEVLNFFGTNWNGVKVCSSYERSNKLPCKEKNQGQIILRNNGNIKDILQL